MAFQKHTVFDFPPTDYVCSRLGIATRELTTLVGSGSSGKSFLLQHIAASVAMGTPIFDAFPVSQRNVMHIDNEQSTQRCDFRYARIWQSIKTRYQDVTPSALTVHALPTMNEQTLSEVRNGLIGEVRERNVGLLVVDSLKAVAGNVDENTGKIGLVVQAFSDVAKETGCAVVLIHHMGKAPFSAKQTGRGHSSIYDVPDMQLDVRYERQNDLTRLTFAKQRDEKLDPVSFRMLDTGRPLPNHPSKTEFLQFELAGHTKPDALEEKVRKVLKSKGPMCKTELHSAIKGSKPAFQSTLQRLVDAGEVFQEIQSHGRHMLSLPLCTA